MEIIKISAKPRSETGKGPSRRLRSSNLIPATAYGKGLPATKVAVSPKSVLQVLGSDHGQNAVVSLEIEGGQALTVMVRDYEYHPVTRQLQHADFLEVRLDEPVDVEVPFRCVGKAAGVAAGGLLTVVFRKLPVRCLPEKIPSFLEADVTPVELGESFKTSMLKLPEGVSVRLPEEQTLATVLAPEKVAEEPAPGAPAAAAKGAPAGKAAAPAAAAKPAPAKKK